MRPTLSRRINRRKSAKVARIVRGFNEADAFASDQPMYSGSEYVLWTCFNEADAFASDQHGTTAAVRPSTSGFNEADAFASDQPRIHPSCGLRHGASMRPTLSRRINIPAAMVDLLFFFGFNEADAFASDQRITCVYPVDNILNASMRPTLSRRINVLRDRRFDGIVRASMRPTLSRRINRGQVRSHRRERGRFNEADAFASDQHIHRHTAGRHAPASMRPTLSRRINHFDAWLVEHRAELQ